MKIKIPVECRHGCMIPLSTEEYKAITEQFKNSEKL